ncbi:unnamed protein product [Adineta steineri]|uniref:Uncharacterized protein n=1 Tax=Adineta steineri TaxID=433720 RepID=A0A818TJ63_9BILA|nr:unnamed protein product [Adineta steineri]
MADSVPLQRSSEVEDLTHLTDKDKKHIAEDAEKGQCGTLHRSEEMEDLAHVSPQDANKPLINDQTTPHVK